MQLEYDFTVPVPVARAWAVLLDLERVVPCLPGAALTSYDGEAFAGTVRVRLGPVSLTYQGRGRIVSRDEDAGRVVVEASGRDTRGGGTAGTTATMTMRPTEDGLSTVVAVAAELSVTGRPAQFGRGMIAEVGGKLVGQFADCLARQLAEAATPMPVGPSAPAPSGTPAAAEVPPAPPAGALADAQAATPAATGAQAATAAAAVAEVPAPTDAVGVAGGTTPPAGAPRARTPADAVEDTAAPAAGPPLAPVPPAPAPPVDLLRVGLGPVLRRVGPYAVVFLAGALVGWGLVTWFG